MHKFEHFRYVKLLYFSRFSVITQDYENYIKIMTLQLVFTSSLGRFGLNLFTFYIILFLLYRRLKCLQQRVLFDVNLNYVIHYNWFSHSGCVPHKIPKFVV